MNKSLLPARLSQNVKIIVIIILVIPTLPLLYNFLPYALDWHRDYEPAALAMLRGDSPYASGFYNPPWTLLPLIPIALLPPLLSRLMIFLLGLGAYIYLLLRLKIKPFPAFLFLSSPAVFGCLYNGNIDWLPLLSIFMPAPLGLMVASMKPQVGLGVGIYWLVEAWYTGGVRRVITTFLPLSLLLFASFLLYGLQVGHFSALTERYWNISFFPYSIPIGLVILWGAIKGKKVLTATAASPFLSPYYTVFSLCGPLLSIANYPRLMALAWILLWGLALVRG